MTQILKTSPSPETPSDTILIGNSFPLPLIRRPVLITPIDKECFEELIAGRRVVSFWGHANTLAVAQAWCGLDLAPATARPPLRLSAEGYPELYGVAYRECLVLSPNYRPDFRPLPGQEVTPEDFLGWQMLYLKWE